MPVGFMYFRFHKVDKQQLLPRLTNCIRYIIDKKHLDASVKKTAANPTCSLRTNLLAFSTLFSVLFTTFLVYHDLKQNIK